MRCGAWLRVWGASADCTALFLWQLVEARTGLTREHVRVAMLDRANVEQRKLVKQRLRQLNEFVRDFAGMMELRHERAPEVRAVVCVHGALLTTPQPGAWQLVIVTTEAGSPTAASARAWVAAAKRAAQPRAS